jgi:tRNA nucleotidyltransferase/poly(A) polymerase
MFLVGGSVRDELLNLNPCDDDYCVVNSSFAQMKQMLIEQKWSILCEKEPFLSIKAKSAEGKVADFVVCRKDGLYEDGRRPKDVTFGTLYDDLARRDFTMNALAKDTKTGDIIDFFHGQEDIKKRLIRCVGSVERLKEDSLRILRAIRFHVILDFHLDADIVAALQDQAVVGLLSKISPERIRQELDKMFQHDTVLTMQVLTRFPLVMHEIFKVHKLCLRPMIQQHK